MSSSRPPVAVAAIVTTLAYWVYILVMLPVAGIAGAAGKPADRIEGEFDEVIQCSRCRVDWAQANEGRHCCCRDRVARRWMLESDRGIVYGC